MPKVCIVSPVHNSTDIRIFKKEAVSLLKLGYDVSVICKSDDANLNKLLGIKVHTLNYTSRLTRLFCIPKVLYLALKEKSDIYHIHNPDTLPVGLGLKLFRKKVIYDTHENFREKILLRIWIHKSIRRFMANFIFYSEKLFSYFFDATIVTQTEQLREYTRSLLIGNSPLISTKSDFRIKKSNKEVIKLVYVGGISDDRGLRHMLKLNSLMNIIKSTQLHLIGPPINSLTSDSLSEVISTSCNVVYHGSLEQEAAFDIVKNSDFGLILLDDVADYRDTSPNKLFEYMMLGTPFIATEFPKWRNLLINEKAGFFISPDNINFTIANQILDERADLESYMKMASAGIKYVNDEYNWVLSDEPKLIKLYRKLMEV